MSSPPPRQRFPPPTPGMPDLEAAKEAYLAAYRRWEESGQLDEWQQLVTLFDEWLAAAKKGE